MASKESKEACNCGAVKLTYRYTDDIQLRSVLCHCHNCMKSCGSIGSNYVIVPRDAISIEGDLTTYLDTKCESGNLQRRFCGICGSPVMAYSPLIGDSLCIVRTTMISAPVKPGLQTYLRNAPVWMPQLEGVQRFDGAPKKP